MTVCDDSAEQTVKASDGRQSTSTRLLALHDGQSSARRNNLASSPLHMSLRWPHRPHHLRHVYRRQ